MTIAHAPETIAKKLHAAGSQELPQEYLVKLAGLEGEAADAAEPPRIILGSRSPRRKLILGDLLGIGHSCIHVDACEQVPDGSFPPDVVSKCLTVQKLIACMKNIDRVRGMGNVLIVGDTVVVGEDGEIVGKEPADLASADERYEYCRNRVMGHVGRDVAVYSSVIVADLRTNDVSVGCDSVVIRFRRHSPEVEKVVDGYCRHVFDEEQVRHHRGPIGKAGSFGIQEPEVLCLVERIRGDITVAVGLPAELTLKMLNELPGMDLPRTYDRERCVDIVLTVPATGEDMPFPADLRSHALDLIS